LRSFWEKKKRKERKRNDNNKRIIIKERKQTNKQTQVSKVRFSSQEKPEAITCGVA